MVNRRHIRIKVMQNLYAFNEGESTDYKLSEKFLISSIQNMYNLYLLQLSLIIEVYKRAAKRNLALKKKHLATEADKNPSSKFLENDLVQFLVNNETLKEVLKNKKLTHWSFDDEYVEIIFQELLKSELYTNYLSLTDTNFKDDKKFLANVFKTIIAPNQKLYEYYEDKNITWVDDLPLVNTVLLKLINNAKQTPATDYFLPDLIKDEDDMTFAKNLLQKTLLNQSELALEINKRTLNWDPERIASIDYILLLMAICEVTYFPFIPVKVTINEYLEIAKEYSTPKSSIFINGVLDKLIKEYSVESKLNKIGRGLQ